MLKLIYLLSLFLFAYGFQDSGHYKGSKSNTKKLAPGEAFMHAAQTGDKSSFTKKNKELLKRFGLLHLLTPSGLHLSAVLGLLLVFLPRRYHIILFVISLLFFINDPALYSLKRVLYFQIIRSFIKSTKSSFLLTFLVDYLTGGFHKSVLSYAYSFLFWGVIIFSPKSTFIVCKNLFFAQLLAINFNQDSLNFFTLVINPIFTSIYSTLFPFMSLNYWLLNLEFLKNFIIEFHNTALNLLWFIDYHLKFFELRPNFVFYLLPFINFAHYKIYWPLLLIPLNLNKVELVKPTHKKFYYSLPSKEKIIRSEVHKVYFENLTCRKKFKEIFWEFSCRKKKPSQKGGRWL